MPVDKYINICLNLKTNINIDTYMLPTSGETEVSGVSEDTMTGVLLHGPCWHSTQGDLLPLEF